MKQKLTFYGTDASNEISLLENGLLVSNELNEDGSRTRFCIYAQGDMFGSGHISEADLNKLLSGNGWIKEDDLKGFYSFVGDTKENYLNIDFVYKLSDLNQYFGPDNITGTDYSRMSKEEVAERYLN
jgi:hypothetical protein